MPFVEGAGARLFYEETGSGAAVVWIHEFAGDYRCWEPQVRHFSRDYRCITYNARGYPPSDVPADPAAYGFEHHRDDVLRVMDALAVTKAHLIGLSMGAYTALQVALKAPDRVASLVLSSCGSSAAGDDRERFKRDTEEAAEQMLRDGMKAGADGLAHGPTRIQLLIKDPRGWQQFRDHMSEHSVLGAALTLKNYQALRPPLCDFEAQLRELDLPVLLAVGDEDDPVMEANLFLKRTLPRAGLWVHSNTGHAINLEEPGEYNLRVAGFLNAAIRGVWPRRDPRADPNRSVFTGHITASQTS
jgi:pimeloyl-ACP methyl ester carboxylesterase